MSEKQRIEKIILLKGLTSGDFAKEIGVQTSTLSHILNERNRPSLDVMRKILNRYQNINSDWLILGQGEMLRDKSHSKASNLFDIPDESSLESDTYPEKAPQNYESEKAPTIIKAVEKSEFRQESRINDSPRLHSEDLPVYGRPYIKEEPKVDKKIERVIIYFTDNTFQEFESK